MTFVYSIIIIPRLKYSESYRTFNINRTKTSLASSQATWSADVRRVSVGPEPVKVQGRAQGLVGQGEVSKTMTTFTHLETCTNLFIQKKDEKSNRRKQNAHFHGAD